MANTNVANEQTTGLFSLFLQIPVSYRRYPGNKIKNIYFLGENKDARDKKEEEIILSIKLIGSGTV